MNEIRRLLHGGDPLRREPLMSAEAAARMRHLVLGHATRRSVVAPAFVMALGGALVLVVGAGVWAVRLPSAVGSMPVLLEHADAADTEMSIPTSDGRRQVQFATPGGTRVIWQLDTTSH